MVCSLSSYILQADIESYIKQAVCRVIDPKETTVMKGMLFNMGTLYIMVTYKVYINCGCHVVNHKNCKHNSRLILESLVLLGQYSQERKLHKVLP